MDALAQENADAPVIASADDAMGFWNEHLTAAPSFRADLEWSGVLFLDADRRVISHRFGSDGAPGWVFDSSREIFRAALKGNAAYIVAMHNHTEGDAQPSETDLDRALVLLRAGELLGVPVVDYLIVGLDGDHCSFAEHGWFEQRTEVQELSRAEEQGVAMGQVMGWLFEEEPRLQPLVSESAVTAGTQMESWLAGLLLSKLREHFSPGVTEDRRHALAAALFDQSKDILPVVAEAARREGIGISQFTWQAALDEMERRFRPAVSV